MQAVLSASDLRRALVSSLDALRANQRAIDALNVFPVPDGDTGTNLVMTFEAIRAAVESTGDRDEEIARAIRSGSLMGARGNSGVIVAQILRGWADAVEAGSADVAGVARGFARSVDLAYEAVLDPAEGTILTVLRAASDAAQGLFDDVADQLAAAEQAAAEAMERTREQLPVLARAGVVDAGAAGLVLVLAALAQAVDGQRIQPPVIQSAPDVQWRCEDIPVDYPYEVMYTVATRATAIPALRQLLGTIGNSVAITGGDGTWRVHVHTDDCDRAVALGAAVGATSEIEVVSFAEQMAAAQPGIRGIGLAHARDAAALVAVVKGEGITRLFEEVGAQVVPEESELLRAIERARSSHVIVLPNGERALAYARALAPQVTKRVTVLPSYDVAAGLVAAVAFGDARAATEVVADMRAALERVRVGSIGPDEENPQESAIEMAHSLIDAETAVLTVFCGSAAGLAERAGLETALRERWGSIAVEVFDGGMAEYRYLLAVE